MKKTILSLCLLVLGIFTHTSIFAGKQTEVVIETSFKTAREASLAAKKALMNQKFIPNGGITDNGFTATRTTGSKADYYTADVMTEDRNGKIFVTITFIKSGTGLLKLQKVADEVKAELGGTEQNGMKQGNVTQPNTPQVQEVAQKNLSQEALQTKCKTFSSMKKGGKVLVVVGGSLLLSGIILTSLNGTTYAMYAAGESMAPVGAVAVGAGIPLLIIGSKKSKQYCALQLKASPSSIALAVSL